MTNDANIRTFVAELREVTVSLPDTETVCQTVPLAPRRLSFLFSRRGTPEQQIASRLDQQVEGLQAQRARDQEPKPRKTEVTFPAWNQVSVEAPRSFPEVTKAYY